MKNFKRILALLVLVIAFYSCDSTVTIDNPENGTIENISADDSGDQGNPVDDGVGD